MVKVKAEKKMNFPELVNWVWNSKKFGRNFISDNGSLVRFGNYGDLIEVFSIEKSDLFTVEVEEEITEETKIPLLLEVYFKRNNVDIGSSLWEYSTISNLKDTRSLAFHMIKPDGTTALLWTKKRGMQ